MSHGMKRFNSPVLIAAAAMIVLPFALLAGGLTLTSATDVVIFAVACMALNILVGHTGLVSFGHGAWFGVGAYAAALTQRYWFPGSVLWPVLTSLVLFVAVYSIVFAMGIYYINRLIERGPQGRAIEPPGSGSPSRPLAAAHDAGREALARGS